MYGIRKTARRNAKYGAAGSVFDVIGTWYSLYHQTGYMLQLLATEVSFERAEAYNIKLLLHTFYETPCARSF